MGQLLRRKGGDANSSMQENASSNKKGNGGKLAQRPEEKPYFQMRKVLFDSRQVHLLNYCRSLEVRR